jgi:Fe-S-cluster containining protein
MTANGKATPFETLLNLPKPTCCSHGDCCKGASPSVPYHQLWEKAKNGDDFARGFLSIMVPYESHEAARTIVPSLVEKTLKAAAKSEKFNGAEDVVFYACRYLANDNRCGVYEDRPQFCREYPDSPFLVMASGCAFEGWSNQCRTKFKAMEAEVDTLHELQASLNALQTYALSSNECTTELVESSTTVVQQQQLARWLEEAQREALLSETLRLTSIWTASPAYSCYSIFNHS